MIVILGKPPRVRFTLSTFLLVVTVLCLVFAVFMIPREQDRWDRHHENISSSEPSEFYLSIVKQGLDIVAIPRQDGTELPDLEKRLLMWHNGERLIVRNLEVDQGITLSGNWPLLLHVVTYRSNSPETLTKLEVRDDGSIATQTIVISAHFDSTEDRFNSPEKLYQHYLKSLPLLDGTTRRNTLLGRSVDTP